MRYGLVCYSCMWTTKDSTPTFSGFCMKPWFRRRAEVDIPCPTTARTHSFKEPTEKKKKHTTHAPWLKTIPKRPVPMFRGLRTSYRLPSHPPSPSRMVPAPPLLRAPEACLGKLWPYHVWGLGRLASLIRSTEVSPRAVLSATELHKFQGCEEIHLSTTYGVRSFGT